MLCRRADAGTTGAAWDAAESGPKLEALKTLRDSTDNPSEEGARPALLR